MALRNAFENLTVENTQARIAAALDALSARLATDAGGRLRVITDSTAVINTMAFWQNANTWAAYYSTGAPASMDAREQQALQSQVNFNSVRSGRWVF